MKVQPRQRTMVQPRHVLSRDQPVTSGGGGEEGGRGEMTGEVYRFLSLIAVVTCSSSF